MVVRFAGSYNIESGHAPRVSAGQGGPVRQWQVGGPFGLAASAGLSFPLLIMRLIDTLESQIAILSRPTLSPRTRCVCVAQFFARKRQMARLRGARWGKFPECMVAL